MEPLLYWHWWVIGLLLMVSEMLLPTAFVLLWIGVSAILVGGAVWLLPSLSFSWQMTLFGGLSLFSFFFWKRFRHPPQAADKRLLNRRGESYVGRSFTLADPIVNGVGKLRVDDSQWRITGPDAPAGTRVRVTRADGATLHVEIAA